MVSIRREYTKLNLSQNYAPGHSSNPSTSILGIRAIPKLSNDSVLEAQRPNAHEVGSREMRIKNHLSFCQQVVLQGGAPYSYKLADKSLNYTYTCHKWTLP